MMSCHACIRDPDFTVHLDLDESGCFAEHFAGTDARHELRFNDDEIEPPLTRRFTKLERS
jgi:hypothetical protein